MKVIIQRVTTAKVTVGEDLISNIGRGLCVLIGLSRDDTEKDIDYMVNKLLGIKIFQDEDGKSWKKSVKDENLEILCISQFTLYHKFKGNKLDFHHAMNGPDAENLYKKFLQKLETKYEKDKIKDGKFGEYMQVHIQNDGPVTIEIESPSKSQEINQS